MRGSFDGRIEAQWKEALAVAYTPVQGLPSVHDNQSFITRVDRLIPDLFEKVKAEFSVGLPAQVIVLIQYAF